MVLVIMTVTKIKMAVAMLMTTVIRHHDAGTGVMRLNCTVTRLITQQRHKSTTGFAQSSERGCGLLGEPAGMLRVQGLRGISRGCGFDGYTAATTAPRSPKMHTLNSEILKPGC